MLNFFHFVKCGPDEALVSPFSWCLEKYVFVCVFIFIHLCTCLSFCCNWCLIAQWPEVYNVCNIGLFCSQLSSDAVGLSFDGINFYKLLDIWRQASTANGMKSVPSLAGMLWSILWFNYKHSRDSIESFYWTWELWFFKIRNDTYVVGVVMLLYRSLIQLQLSKSNVTSRWLVLNFQSTS